MEDAFCVLFCVSDAAALAWHSGHNLRCQSPLFYRATDNTSNSPSKSINAVVRPIHHRPTPLAP